MTTFAMFAALNKRLIGLAEDQRREFEHIETALGDIMRDLADIKSRVAVRKADKRTTGAGRSPKKSRI